MTNKKKMILVIAAFAVVLLGANMLYRTVLPAADGGISQGETTVAPDFSVTNANGETVALSDYQGKPVVLNFWASWCGPCRNEMVHFDAAAAAYQGKVDFMMVNLTDGSRETVSTATDFIEEQGYELPVFYDTLFEGAKAYAVRSIPVTFFIDGNGLIREYYAGSISEAALNEGVHAIID